MTGNELFLGKYECPLFLQMRARPKIWANKKTSSLADIYGVPTSQLNEQVKRNIERFPEDFMFKRSVEEWEHLISQFATSSQHH